MFYRKKLMYRIGAPRVRVPSRGVPCKLRVAGGQILTLLIGFGLTDTIDKRKVGDI